MPTITEVLDARKSTEAPLIQIQLPSISDGAEMWRIARDSGSLDLNSSYAYMLYARDFPRTCRVARVNGEVVGFVIANFRPERPDCLFVWQIAVDSDQQGLGLAGRMLDHLLIGLRASEHKVRTVETTITDDNTASQRLFRSFAKRWNDAKVTKAPLFEEDHFPDGHDAEPLYEIGPIDPDVRV